MRDFFDEESGQVWSSIHSWLVQVDGLNILVDTCSGNGKVRALPRFQRFHMLDFPFIDTLAAAGITPEEVDIVFCTHLHIDHVGWNTRLENGRWVPAFPNARYIFGRAEFDHWTNGDGPRLFPDNVAVIEDSVLPVVEAGLVEFVEDGDEIVPGLRVELAPGHTATQLILKHEAPGGGFVISADVIHQPIQVYAPHLNSCFCEIQDAARTTRRKLLDHCAGTGAILLPMHFGPPHAGKIHRAGMGFAFEPAEAAVPA
nr:MBL fold metallo-hydrolase [Tianweitania sediminis]